MNESFDNFPNRFSHTKFNLPFKWNNLFLMVHLIDVSRCLTDNDLGKCIHVEPKYKYFASHWNDFISTHSVFIMGTGHYDDVIMSAIASKITSLSIVYSAVYSGADQIKHQSSASLAFVWGIHRGPVNSPHKRPVTRKMFPFDDVIMW